MPIRATDGVTLEMHIVENVKEGAAVYTDCHKGCNGMRGYRHEAVAHSAGEYVRGQIHTNGIESFWAILKRGYIGTHHWVSVKHLSRYVDEFAHRHHSGDMNSLDFIAGACQAMIGCRLTHNDLVRGGNG